MVYVSSTPKGAFKAARPRGLYERLNLLFFDCTTHFSGRTGRAIGAADLALVPNGPDKLDLAAAASSVDMADPADVSSS